MQLLTPNDIINTVAPSMPATPASEVMRLFYEGVMTRSRKRQCRPNPPEIYTITLPSIINTMDPRAGDDYAEKVHTITVEACGRAVDLRLLT